MVEVIPRSAWGARHEDGGGSAPVPFTEWWLHHSVTTAPDLVPPFDDEYRVMRTLEDIGEQRFGRGISYTWLIMPNGRVYQGHSVNRLGAHTGGRNSVARAICLVGNYEVADITGAQIESAAQLMVQEYRAGRARRATLNGGHRDLKATSCPGKYAYAAIGRINARAIALLNGAPPIEEEDMPITNEDVQRIAEAVWGSEIKEREGIGPAQARDWLTHSAVYSTRILGLVGKLMEQAIEDHPDLTPEQVEEAVEKAILDAGATLRAAEGKV